MTNQQAGAGGRDGINRASDVVAAQVREIRGRRGLTVKALAARCCELGAAELTANVLVNIEVRRRDVSVDELLVLALALDAAPTHLLTPPPGADTGLRITATVQAAPGDARSWVYGDAPLPECNAAIYLQEAADRGEPMQGSPDARAAAVLSARAAALADQYEQEAQSFLGRVRTQVTDLVGCLEDSVKAGVSADDLVQVLETVKARVQPARSVTGPGTD